MRVLQIEYSIKAASVKLRCASYRHIYISNGDTAVIRCEYDRLLFCSTKKQQHTFNHSYKCLIKNKGFMGYQRKK